MCAARLLRTAKEYAQIHSLMWADTIHVVRTRDGAIRATYCGGRRVGP